MPGVSWGRGVRKESHTILQVGNDPHLQIARSHMFTVHNVLQRWEEDGNDNDNDNDYDIEYEYESD